jgi:uncharacterized protein (TIGR01589 family)
MATLGQGRNQVGISKKRTGDGGGNRRKQKAQKISWDDIKFVQNLIERCLLQYMTQAEIITALQAQANIDPAFTCLVWEKLLDQNRDFFYLYGIKLRLKDQVVAFNYLVDQHVQILKAGLTEVEHSVGNPLSMTSTGASVSTAVSAVSSDSAKLPTHSPMPSPVGADTDKFFA